jgi:hypothetical protein
MSGAATKGGAVLGLLAGLTKAVAMGFSAAKGVEEGCESCPEKSRKRRISYGKRRSRRSR